MQSPQRKSNNISKTRLRRVEYENSKIDKVSEEDTKDKVVCAPLPLSRHHSYRARATQDRKGKQPESRDGHLPPQQPRDLKAIHLEDS